AETAIFSPCEAICWKCGVPALAGVEEENRQNVRCRGCDDEAYTVARACGIYEGALRASILALKSEPHVCSRLARLLFDTARVEPLNASTRIVPVPLHPERESQRGFNQAKVLGRTLARTAGLTFDETSLVRSASTERHRGGMDARARRESVE